MFKYAMPDRWMVVVNSPKLLDELRQAQDNELSFLEAMVEVRPSSSHASSSKPRAACFCYAFQADN